MQKNSKTQRGSPDVTCATDLGNSSVSQTQRNFPLSIVKPATDIGTFRNIPDKEQIEMMKLKTQVNVKSLAEEQIRRNTVHTVAGDDNFYSTFNTHRFPSVAGNGSKTVRQNNQLFVDERLSGIQSPVSQNKFNEAKSSYLP